MQSVSRTVIVLCVLLAFTSTSCNVVKELAQGLTNLTRCSFKLQSVSDFKLAGISLTGKNSLGLGDAAKALASFTRGELPAGFVLNVGVKNPNDGTGGTTKAAAVMTGFAWNLRLDNTPTISGNIADPIKIPAAGQETVIPLNMNLDLMKFFKDKGYDKILNLAMALGGAQGSASRVTLRATPTIKTDLGPLTYPGEIDIIDKEFRGDRN
jgi:hypothetical protein